MKSFKILLTVIFLVAITSSADAQVKDWLNKKKAEAKEKAAAKIEQKSSEGIDKAVNAPETAIKKKKEKKGKKEEAVAANADVESKAETAAGTKTKKEKSDPIEVVNEAPNENGATVILTSIKCEEGKKAIIKLLKKQDGVMKVDVNIKNGELSIEYSSDGTSYMDIIKLINETGFDADGNLATGKKFNCK